MPECHIKNMLNLSSGYTTWGRPLYSLWSPVLWIRC